MCLVLTTKRIFQLKERPLSNPTTLYEDVLAQNNAVFENFFERILANLFADDRLDPVKYFFLLFRFATLTHATVQMK